ncbi:hypothetical protein [Clostridium sp. Cult3]|uniref:hypothetical protein n=1 Tax=Clostridium sp. Cult3 TaxID=2079004 RepID=UPI001F430BBF|nr:hypothetical protein [Clostridium sp. Cult3]MCF6459465.1 hypothetical protein [Clostridium sp. Cult3]
MSGNFTYIRKYIILKNDYTNIVGLDPKGHVKIEVRGTRGVLSINTENCQKEEDYRVYLLKDQGGEVGEYDLGRIITDERGRSRTDFSLNLRDLELKGFSIDEIDAILIRKGIYILLGGYIDKDRGTIDRYVKTLILEEESLDSNRNDSIENSSIEEIETVALEVKASEELTIEELTEEIPVIEEELESIIIDEAEEVLEEIEETEEIEIEEIEEDLEEPIEPFEVEEEKSIDIDESKYEQEDSAHHKMENYQSLEYIRRLNHKNQMTNYILSILRFFPYVQPLKLNLHGYSWWRIDDDGTDSYKGFLPYFNYLMSTDYKYPFLNNSTTCFDLIRKYGHYLFGMYKEDRETKYYIYGVPGKFATSEYPFKGITGFNTWYESANGLGYWILYIDPMTGKIIYPLNPMVPAY